MGSKIKVGIREGVRGTSLESLLRESVRQVGKHFGQQGVMKWVGLHDPTEDLDAVVVVAGPEMADKVTKIGGVVVDIQGLSYAAGVREIRQGIIRAIEDNWWQSRDPAPASRRTGLILVASSRQPTAVQEQSYEGT